MSATSAKGESDIWEARRSASKLARPKAGYRDDYNRDRARVIHSAAFRRLQAKTQVLGIGEGDFHRTRLTHSMEVAQIARGIVRSLQANYSNGKAWANWLPNPNVIETIALAHDLGHPPFGHGGEVALNYAMCNAGGFEGNGQTLRLLSRLEAHTDGFGLDLTRRCLLGVLKYPVPYERVVRKVLPESPERISQLNRNDWKPPKCYMSTEEDVVQWILDPFSAQDTNQFMTLDKEPTEKNSGKSKYKAFDTSIMELADDIAYGVHDFEDAIALRMASRGDWEQAAAKIEEGWGAEVGLYPINVVSDDLFDGSSSARKRAIGTLVNAFVVSINVEENQEFDHPLLIFKATLKGPAGEFLSRLKSLVINRVIKTQQVQTLEYRGQQLIMSIYDALASDPERLLKEGFRDMYASLTGNYERQRVLCDYIAGMTDEYATRMYERLYVPRHGQFSDRL